MKTLLSLLLFLIALFSTVAQSQSNFTAQPKVPQTVQPSCAQAYSVSLISESACAFTDIACLCTNQPLAESLSICVKANCTIREQLTDAKFSAEFCGAPYVDNTRYVAIVGLLGGVLAYLAVGLRIWARLRGINGDPGPDDICLLIAAVLVIPFTALSVVLSRKGLGLDLWEVPFDNITDILRIYWWDEIVYTSALPLTKMSILYFYLRIFTHKTFRRIVYFMIILNGIGGLAFIIACITQCIPIYGGWTFWDGTFVGHCNNFNIQAWMNGTFNMIMDIITLLLPMPEVYKLRLPFRKKLHIFLMFNVGFFVTIISILRIHTVIKFGTSANFTQDYVINGCFSTIEVHASVLCACMPAIRQLLRDFFPTMMGVASTTVNSSQASRSLSKPTKISSKNHMILSSREYGKMGSQDDHSSDHALVDLERHVSHEVPV